MEPLNFAFNLILVTHYYSMILIDGISAFRIRTLWISILMSVVCTKLYKAATIVFLQLNYKSVYVIFALVQYL